MRETPASTGEGRKQMKYVAYEGDDRLSDAVTKAEAEAAIRRARREAGPMAKRRVYTIRTVDESRITSTGTIIR